MRVYEHYNDYPMSAWRWPSFSPQEIACRGDAKLAVDEAAMDKLQALRNRLGTPLIVNSAYRSPEYNRRIGGATRSMHMQAKAFDISMANHDPAIFEAAAREVGFTGFGFYQRNNFMHIDTGPAREWGERWFARTDTSRYDAVTSRFPAERPLQPERASEDRDLIGSVVGGGGAVGGGAAVLTGLGGLSPVAQVVAVAGLVLAVAALAYIFRNRIKRLAK